jgi:hypothetical protein
MTARERSALTLDFLAYGQLWKAQHKHLEQARALARELEAALQASRYTRRMIYHASELAKMREGIKADADLAGRMARAARDLHLELLGGHAGRTPASS